MKELPVEKKSLNLNKKTVQKVSNILHNFGYSEGVKELSETARTAKDAAVALRVPVGAIVKSLLFLIDNEREEIPVVALISGDKKCKTDLLPKVLNIDGNVRRPDAVDVKRITGYSIGGVSPLGLPSGIEIVIDTSLSRFEKIWSAAGHTHCIFPTTFLQLKDMTDALESDEIT